MCLLVYHELFPDLHETVRDETEVHPTPGCERGGKEFPNFCTPAPHHIGPLVHAGCVLCDHPSREAPKGLQQRPTKNDWSGLGYLSRLRLKHKPSSPTTPLPPPISRPLWWVWGPMGGYSPPLHPSVVGGRHLPLQPREVATPPSNHGRFTLAKPPA